MVVHQPGEQRFTVLTAVKGTPVDKCVISEVSVNQESARELRRFEESDARQRFGTEGRWPVPP